MNDTAKPAYCRKCGSAIWQQVIPGVVRVDVHPLRTVAEELAARLAGRATHQLHRVGQSFHINQRYTWNLNGDYETKIVLADHACTTLPVTEHPDYWPTKRKPTTDVPDF